MTLTVMRQGKVVQSDGYGDDGEGDGNGDDDENFDDTDTVQCNK